MRSAITQIKDKRILNPVLSCDIPLTGNVLAFNILLYDYDAYGLTQTFQRRIQEKYFQ